MKRESTNFRNKKCSDIFCPLKMRVFREYMSWSHGPGSKELSGELSSRQPPELASLYEQKSMVYRGAFKPVPFHLGLSAFFSSGVIYLLLDFGADGRLLGLSHSLVSDTAIHQPVYIPLQVSPQLEIEFVTFHVIGIELHTTQKYGHVTAESVFEIQISLSALAFLWFC